MASLFKPTVTTYQLPDGRHRTPDGKRVIKDTPGAIRVAAKSEIWYGKYKDSDGRFHKVPLGADKTAAKQILAKLVTDAKLAEHGMRAAFDAHQKRPLTEHVEAYRRYLESKNNCPRHVADTIAQCVAIFEGTGAKFISDLDSDRVAEWLAEERDAGMGISTSNHYVTAGKGFSRWLVKSRKTSHDPLTYLSRLNADTDIRRRRRPLSLEEALLLLDKTRASDSVFR